MKLIVRPTNKQTLAVENVCVQNIKIFRKHSRRREVGGEGSREGEEGGGKKKYKFEE